RLLFRAGRALKSMTGEGATHSFIIGTASSVTHAATSAVSLVATGGEEISYLGEKVYDTAHERTKILLQYNPESSFIENFAQVYSIGVGDLAFVTPISEA